jgi:hypothetical protein
MMTAIRTQFWALDAPRAVACTVRQPGGPPKRAKVEATTTKRCSRLPPNQNRVGRLEIQPYGKPSKFPGEKLPILLTDRDARIGIRKSLDFRIGGRMF